MRIKPSIPKGMRDFGPGQVLRRRYITGVMQEIFENFGYRPIETPAMENLSTLTGKYGDEGDKLLFKVLNSGDFLGKADVEAIENRDSKKLALSIAGKGLRYDLTIPFARYVVMHQNEIVFPFRRYQMQPVWRADRPQKGRYREFWQCDADIIGSKDMINEAEFIQIYSRVFKALKLDVTIHVNNRKILAGIAEIIGAEDQFIPLTVALDKLDKIGLEGVFNELKTNGFPEKSTEKLAEILSTDNLSLETVSGFLKESETGSLGVSKMQKVFGYLSEDIMQQVKFDLILARGLNYYTGCIFEVKANGANIGSVGGGGRYDDLTGVFGLPDVSGVGISFGLDRIYDAMEELNLFPGFRHTTRILFINFDEQSEGKAFELVTQLRELNIPAEIYPNVAKMKKQMKYADANQIPFVAMLGSEEIGKGVVSIKDMQTGQQETLTFEALIKKLKTGNNP
jgi:histidyl-tRNA synthetase